MILSVNQVIFAFINQYGGFPVTNIPDCKIIVSEFKFQSWYDINFCTDSLDSPGPTSYGLNVTSTVQQAWVLH